MLNIGKKLFSLYHSQTSESHNSDKPFVSRPSASFQLEQMSAAIPGADNKWKLTNIGGIGSEEDKDLRERAAAAEQAFDHAGECDGIEIWRIEKFEPEKLDAIRADNLSLYSGDCYIVLKTTEKEEGDGFDWQLHYWIGKDSTQDEWTAASYFTVNLDDLLQQRVRWSHLRRDKDWHCRFALKLTDCVLHAVYIMFLSPCNIERCSTASLPCSIPTSGP